MILLPEKTLSERALRMLKKYQQTVTDSGDYAAQVSFAGLKFGSVNTVRNLTFSEVRDKLLQMSSGAERCHYCEDSKADEVEHIAPKSWYPDKCFVWENYCIACGPCNGPKNAQFAVFKEADGLFFEFVERKKDDPIESPPSGRPVLVNPRFENPLQFLFLDIQGDTFYFEEWAEEGTEEFERAKYTIKILGLNSRSYLPVARRKAYDNYRARLREYLVEKTGNAEQAKLDKLTIGIRAEHHPSVWAEMKRQWQHIPEIRPLFAEIQEEMLHGVL